MGIVGTYDIACNQFGTPKIPELWGMTGSLLPWWAWLLILETVSLVALFEYGWRKKPPASAGADFASGLYVGELRLSANHLGDGYLELAVRGFNGTGEPIGVAEVLGHIRLEGAVETDPEELVALPRPVLLTDRTSTKNIAPKAEIFLVLHQYLDRRRREIVSRQIMKKGARFNLKEFKIEMASVSDPTKCAPLPFWAGIFVRSDNWAGSDRIIEVEMQAVTMPAPSIGTPQ